jgi:hypothetical protein
MSQEGRRVDAVESNTWFNFNEMEYVEGLWFTCSPLRDLMGMVWKTKSGQWIARYRIRNYDPATTPHLGGKGTPWDDKDTRSGGETRLLPGEEPKGLIDTYHKLFMDAERWLRAEGETKYFYYPVKGDKDKAVEVLRTAPFVHMKKLHIQ